jgi:hypothetical protein
MPLPLFCPTKCSGSRGKWETERGGEKRKKTALAESWKEGKQKAEGAEESTEEERRKFSLKSQSNQQTKVNLRKYRRIKPEEGKK